MKCYLKYNKQTNINKVLFQNKQMGWEAAQQEEDLLGTHGALGSILSTTEKTRRVSTF